GRRLLRGAQTTPLQIQKEGSRPLAEVRQQNRLVADDGHDALDDGGTGRRARRQSEGECQQDGGNGSGRAHGGLLYHAPWAVQLGARTTCVTKAGEPENTSASNRCSRSTRASC